MAKRDGGYLRPAVDTGFESTGFSSGCVVAFAEVGVRQQGGVRIVEFGGVALQRCPGLAGG